MENGELNLNIFDTIINPDIEEEQKAKKTKKDKEKKQPIDYKKEYEEAKIKLQSLYNFDKYLKLDIPTRLMSIYGIGMNKFNFFMYGNEPWYEIHWKHIEITIREKQLDFKEEKILLIDKIYRLFDDKDSFIKFATYSE